MNANLTRAARLGLPVLLVIGAGSLLFSGFTTTQAQAWIAGLGHVGMIAFAGTSVVLMSLFMPKTAISISAGVLFGFPVGAILMTGIAITAALLNYTLGRWWLHDSIHAFLRQRAATNRAIGWLYAVRDVIGDAGFAMHLLARLAPIPTTIISYTCGASAARIGPFLGAATVGVVPQWLWVYSAAGAGKLGQNPDHDTASYLSVAFSVTIALAISILIPQAARKKMDARGT